MPRPFGNSFRLSRLMFGALGLLALCALGAAPAQSCGPLPGTGGGDAGPPPPNCGDGQISGREECDGTNLGGKTCATASSIFASGTLRCDPNTCTFDVRKCEYPKCGNGILEP